MDIRKIRIEDFNYTLPDERIALHPLQQRDACKLLVANAAGKLSHHIFSDLPILVHPDTLIVANETKVIRARLEFVKETGARIEIFLLDPHNPHDYVSNFASTDSCSWVCLIGNRKRWKEGRLHKNIVIEGKEVTLSAALEDTEAGIVRFSWDNPEFSFAEVLENAGNIPIPPYLKRESEESDTTDYQTIFSRTEGSVAAPTAGLHFTPELLSELKRHGNEFVTVTLHVGAGTFQPVKSEEIGDHPMHSEWISVNRKTLSRLTAALEEGRDILAVGTTSVRTLESLPYIGALIKESDEEAPPVSQWMPYEERFRNIDTIGSLKRLLAWMKTHALEEISTFTSIMIAPGFRWRVVDRLITNFHQPKSTLLLLVSSFLGNDSDSKERWRRVYDAALEKDYRFLSYGDACLFTRGRQSVELPVSKSMALRAALIYAVRFPDSPYLLDRIPITCDDVAHFISSMCLCMVSRLSPGLVNCNIGEGAAPLRFLLAYAASLSGAKLAISCEPSLRRRPIRPLIDSLVEMGAAIEMDEDDENWEIRVLGSTLSADSLKVDTSFTSQFLSALLLVSPLWAGEAVSLEKFVANASVSRPYIRMSEEMMAREEVEIEPDWSAAAFFYEYCFISGKGVDFCSLTPPSQSLQGDAAVCDIFSRLGVNTLFHKDGSASLSLDEVALSLLSDGGVFEFDFTDCPDLVPAVTVALCYRRIPFVFHGVGHLRFKECDRLQALQSSLSCLGYQLEAEKDTLRFNGEFKPLQDFPVAVDSFGDHRMAMAFYPLELLGMVKIEDKGVVSKSFPNFYQQFK